MYMSCSKKQGQYIYEATWHDDTTNPKKYTWSIIGMQKVSRVGHEKASKLKILCFIGHVVYPHI